ncbi:MAG TPA: S8 family serine peptidase, partial [Candidatus Nitrosotalea sp.]|nr:S8 family serine peptidase [Candidatus Nitrosotalea sp.]
MISNNSWGYPGALQYNSASASYDEAVRDALPGVPGSQPLLYVFAAGNGGFGTTNGVGGEAGSILAPANAKNVIAVGALESPRGLTNDVFAGYTDSDNEVAAFSSRGNVGIGTEGVFGRFKPDVIAPGTFIVSTRSENAPADPTFDLGPLYRYDSGTSMAAPAVSGLLALMQEFFEQQLHQGFSPALFKALLINGSRSVNQNYDLQVRKSLNIQGWGLVNLTNSLPSALTNQTDETQWPIRLVDQSPTNVLTTGQSHTWKVALSPDAQSLPLRATLVWTDPPGNPGAAIKLVNNLDLIVTNLDTGEVFLGNDIPAGAEFTSPVGTDPSANDFVNNVENVFLKGPLGTNYSITVVGRRINVNAVTADTTGIVQDYALVVSSGNGEVPGAFQSWTREATPQFTPPLIPITNGIPTMRQRVGANFQLTPSPDGTPAQWTFFVFTNVFTTNNFSGMTNGSNVAFITFLPPNAARPRNLDADIDLYVSQDPQLTNLSPAVLSAPSTSKSLHRGGTESVVFTNAPVGPDVVYYVGVKSEDQQAAEFGIIALSTDLPFDAAGPNGSRVLHGYPANVPIPDGSPQAPGGALVFAIGVEPVIVGQLTVAEQITHQSIGDLLGNLSHQDQFAVLNNHVKVADPLQTVFNFFYDDSGGGQFFNSQHTDGPGSLNNFVGQAANGVWLLTMTDDSSGQTGVVNNLTITIAPQQFTASGADIADIVLGNQWRYYAVDVPANASTLTVFVSQMSGPLNVYLRHGDPPTTTDYDKSALLTPPGGAISLGLGDVPPLTPGICWIGVFNPTAVWTTYHIAATIGYSLAPSNAGQAYSGDTPLTILDDAVTTSSLFVPSGRSVVDVSVGVRIDHPRASDLVLHLTNPQGARTLLAENRGGESTAGYGATLTTTNVFPRTSSGGPEEDRNVIGTGLTSGQIKIDYDFFTVPDDLRVYYEGVLLFDTGLTNGAASISVNFGPGLSTNVTIVVNEGGSADLTTQWTYTASVVQEKTLYTTFTDSTNLADVPIKFAIPPFTNSLIGTTRTNQTILIDGFEHATNGTYPVGSYVSGWRVSYGMAVVHGTNNPLGILPDSGTNFVELIEPGSPGSPSGVLTNITVTPGRPYRLSFAYNRNPRTPAGQQNVVAVYTNGVLGQFVFIQTPGWQTATYDFKTSSGS